MLKRTLVLALFLSALFASSVQAAPRQWITPSGLELHWATTVQPFQVNPGYNGARGDLVQRSLTAWDQSTALAGSNYVPLGSAEQDFPIYTVPNTGQDWAGIAYASYDGHGAFSGLSGNFPTAGPRIEVRADYAGELKVYAHEIGHLLGFDHSSSIYTDCDEVMSYCWGANDSLPGAEEIAFHPVIQDHLDAYTSLNGPESDGTTDPPPPPPDTDGDGVPDDVDQCDTQAGPASNNGCPIPQPPRPCKPHKFKPCPSTGVIRKGNKFSYRKDGNSVVVYADPERGREFVRINPKTGLPAGVRP